MDCWRKISITLIDTRFIVQHATQTPAGIEAIPAQQHPIFTSPDAVSGGPKASCGTGSPWRTRYQLHAALHTTRITPTMKMVISAESKYPVNTMPGLEVSGQKMFWIERTPAVTVVTPTKHIGAAVIHAYLALPMLMRNVVATASAMVASNWLPVPNKGQMVEIVPV